MTADRRDRRLLGLGGFTALGALLLVIAFVLEARESRRRAVAPPEPAWRVAENSRAAFVDRLRPLAAAEMAWLRDRHVPVAALHVFDPNSTTEFRMSRTLQSGHLYAADLRLACRTTDDTSAGLEVTILRPDAPAEHLRIGLRAGVVTSARQAGPDTTRWMAWQDAPAWPLSLGDLPIAEAAALAQAARTGAFRPIGCLTGRRVRPLYVFEVDLAPWLAGLPSPNPAAGQHALAYVDSVTAELRAVSVLDASGHRVRSYEDFEWESTSPRRLRSIRVTSLPNRSHTLFRRVGAGPGAGPAP